MSLNNYRSYKSTTNSTNLKPEIKQFKSAPGIMINSEKIEISHQNKQNKPITIDQKKIDEKIKNLALKQHETLMDNANFDNIKNSGKKTLKISEIHRRSVLYESDRDNDLSSDCRSSGGQEQKKEISITGEKIISTSVSQINNNKKNEQSSNFSKPAEIIYRGIRKPIKKPPLPKKQIKEGYLQINDDEEISPQIFNSNINQNVDRCNEDKIFFSDASMKQFSTMKNTKLQMEQFYESPVKQNEEKIMTTNTTYNPNGFKSTAPTTISGYADLK